MHSGAKGNGGDAKIRLAKQRTGQEKASPVRKRKRPEE